MATAQERQQQILDSSSDAPTRNTVPDSAKSANKAPVQDFSKITDAFKSGFAGTDYGNSQAFQDLLSQYDPKTNLINTDQATMQQGRLRGYADTFASQFKNLVGRDPTTAEYNEFFGQVVAPNKPWLDQVDQSKLAEQTTGLLNSAFSSTVSDAATQKAQNQVNTLLSSGGPLDTYQQALDKSLGDTQKSLQDYQSRLFEKIRPQLLTSLQAQGLLDTGGLNEAFAGVAGDLDSEAQNFLSQAKSSNDADVANKRLAISSSPTNSSLSNIFSTVPNLTQSGQGALNNVFSNYMNTNLANINASNQRNLYQMQLDNQPSVLQGLGGQIVGGLAGGFARGAFA